MSKDKRFDAERRLKNGELRALVATASLELGIDVGSVDLVCQIGASKTIAWHWIITSTASPRSQSNV